MRCILLFSVLFFFGGGAVHADTTVTALDTIIAPESESLGDLLLITYLDACECTREASIQYLEYFRDVIIPDTTLTSRLRIRILDMETNQAEADSLLNLGVDTLLPLIRLSDETGTIRVEQSYDPVDTTFVKTLRQFFHR